MLVRLKGSYTVERIAELKSELLAHMDVENPIELSFKEVDAVDLSLFLVLHSAVKTYAKHDQKLFLCRDLPARFAGKAVWAGFSELIGESA